MSRIADFKLWSCASSCTEKRDRSNNSRRKTNPLYSYKVRSKNWPRLPRTSSSTIPLYSSSSALAVSVSLKLDLLFMFEMRQYINLECTLGPIQLQYKRDTLILEDKVYRTNKKTVEKTKDDVTTIPSTVPQSRISYVDQAYLHIDEF